MTGRAAKGKARRPAATGVAAAGPAGSSADNTASGKTDGTPGGAAGGKAGGTAGDTAGSAAGSAAGSEIGGTAGGAVGSGKRGRGRPRDLAVDDAILRAALDLFIERGVEGMSMERVARDAGVGKLTVYRRWSSKEDLLAQALESVFRPGEWIPDPGMDAHELTTYIERAIEVQSELAAQPRYQALMARILGISRSHPRLMRVYWDRFAVPRRAATRALLEHAVADGRLPADTDVDVLMDMLVGAITYRLLQPDPPSAEELRRYQRAVFHQTGLL